MPASVIYDSFPDDVSKGNILSSDTFFVMLVSGYTPNRATHTKRSDVTGEITGTGYSSGGVTDTNTEALDTTNHKVTWTFGNVSFTSSTLSATGAVIYKHRGGASSADNLVAYVDFGGTVSDTAGTFSVTYSSPLTIQD